MKGSKKMELKKAEVIAKNIMETLKPFCEKIEIVGSIRRKKQEVKDIDIVLIPKDIFNLQIKIQKLGKSIKDGLKYKQLRLKEEINCDIFLCDKNDFGVLKLLKTGSQNNNIILCSQAKRKGWKLGANGLIDNKDKVIAKDEINIYKELRLEYKQPEERE